MVRKMYKVVLNVVIEDPEKRFPAGGDYTHMNRIQGLVHNLTGSFTWPGMGVNITLDKLIDKGEVDDARTLQPE